MLRNFFQFLMLLALIGFPVKDVSAQAVKDESSSTERPAEQQPPRLSDEKMKLVFEITAKANEEEKVLIKELVPLMANADTLLTAPRIKEEEYLERRSKIDAIITALSQHKAKTALKIAKALDPEERKIMFGMPKIPEGLAQNPDAPKPPAIMPKSEIQMPGSFIEQTKQSPQ